MASLLDEHALDRAILDDLENAAASGFAGFTRGIARVDDPIALEADRSLFGRLPDDVSRPVGGQDLDDEERRCREASVVVVLIDAEHYEVGDEFVAAGLHPQPSLSRTPSDSSGSMTLARRRAMS